MRKVDFTVEEVRDYYNGDFGRDLMRYFTLEPPCRRGRDYPMILHMTSRFNKSRGTDGSPSLSAIGQERTRRNFIFSGIFYFMLLIPQTIRKVCGEEAETDFYRSTGWPLSSAGMGGYLPPEQMLGEASLLPCEEERDNYYAMLNIVAPFMIHEFSEFLLGINPGNINKLAYDRLRDTITDHALSLIDRVVADAKEFSNAFQPRLTALRGDIFTLDKSKYDAAVAFVHGGFNGFDCMLADSHEKIAQSKIGYVIYRDYVHRGQPYRPYISDFRRFANEQEIEDYIKRMISESLDFALKCGNRIAFHGLQIHGWNEEKNEKLSVSVVRGWLDEHPLASVTMVDIRGCFGKYLVEID